MRYKVGDKIKIKKQDIYDSLIEKELKENNYILTISRIDNDVYHTEEINTIWDDEEIVGLVEDLKCNPIKNRFEILDL